MLIENMDLYTVFSEALSDSRKNSSIIIPAHKVMDMLRICITNCIGNKYDWHIVDIDDEYYGDYNVSFFDLDGVTNIFIEKCIHNDKYLNSVCGALYVDTECDNEVFNHTTMEETHIFKTTGGCSCL